MATLRPDVVLSIGDDETLSADAAACGLEVGPDEEPDSERRLYLGDEKIAKIRLRCVNGAWRVELRGLAQPLSVR